MILADFYFLQTIHVLITVLQIIIGKIQLIILANSVMLFVLPVIIQRQMAVQLVIMVDFYFLQMPPVL